MSIQPKGDSIRRAVQWISDERKFNANVNLTRLVEKAAVDFNLNPKEVEYLTRLVKEEPA